MAPTCYRPTYTTYNVQPGRYDNASPPRQPAAASDEWMYGCPQSRTFKILESVMHNEGSQLGAACCQLLSAAVFVQFLKPCPHCRRKVRQSTNFAVVSPFSATVALFCDSVDRALFIVIVIIIISITFVIYNLV